MYKIKIIGEAGTDYSNLKELDGISAYDCFCDYIDDDFGCVTGGYLEFKFINNKLMSVTTYDSTRLLTPEEVKSLEDYTQGQWSDGIGEGFEQNACHYDTNGEEVFISPWCSGQKLVTKQIKV